MVCPVFPPPLKNKAQMWRIFLSKRYSWLEALYERSYKMKMGEFVLPGFRLLMANHPPVIKKMMQTEPRVYPKHPMLGDALRPLLGDSIFTTNGQQWQEQRALLDPAFAQASVSRVLPRMQAAVAEMMDRIEKNRRESGVKGFDIDREMTFVTADIIFRTILSARLEAETGEQLVTAFQKYQALVPKATLVRLFRLPTWLAPQRRLQAAASVIRQEIDRLVKKRCQETDLNHDDLLSALLAAMPQERPFSMDEIVDQIAMLFLAGHETSASALSWTLYLLAIDPKEQDAVRAEVCAVAPLGRELSLSALAGLGRLRNVFREALRLYPPVGFFARVCAQERTEQGKTIHEGDTVILSPWLMHRHQAHWERPHDFIPQRFERESHEPRPAGTYFPFGLGERVCIGAAFAQQEALLILASLLRRYRWQLAAGFTPQPVGRLTIRSENGMWIVLTPLELEEPQ